MITTETKDMIVRGLNRADIFSRYTISATEEHNADGSSTWLIRAKVAASMPNGKPLNLVHSAELQWLSSLSEAQRGLTDDPCWWFCYTIAIDDNDGRMYIDIH